MNMVLRTILSAALMVSIAPQVSAEMHERASLMIEERQQLDNTYIFRFTDNVTRGNERGRASELVSGAGGQLRFVYTNAYRGFAATLPPQAVARVANARGIAEYTKDRRVDASAKPPWAGGPGGGDDTSGEIIPWGIARMNAIGNTSIDFTGYKAYVIDSGIDSNHPDLNVIDGYAVEKCKGGSCNEDWDDDNNHGTHVSGTIAAKDNDSGVIGVAPGLSLVAVKVLSKSGSGSWSGVIAGIDWVAGQDHVSGAVANMSLGGTGSDGNECDFGVGMSNTGNALKDAICEATQTGVIFVVAAGNETDNAGNHVPAAFDNTLVTVSSTAGDALTECTTGSKDSWSGFSNYGDDVEIGAPGSGVLSTIPGGGTATFSGTSMASPHVAGAAAVWLTMNVDAGDETNFQGFESTIHNDGSWNEASSGACWNSEAAHPEGFINTPTP
jgi:subtilisin